MSGANKVFASVSVHDGLGARPIDAAVDGETLRKRDPHTMRCVEYVPRSDLDEAVGALDALVQVTRAFRRPIGAPGSAKRAEQDEHIAAEDAAIRVIEKARGGR